jgi:hypothetical protein
MPPPRGVSLRVTRTGPGERSRSDTIVIPLWAGQLLGPFLSGDGGEMMIIAVDWVRDGKEITPAPPRPAEPEELIATAMALLGQARELLAERISRAGS